MTNDKPRAFAGFDSEAGVHQRAIAWLSQQVENVGGVPLLFVPQKQNLDSNRTFMELSKRIPTATWRSEPKGRWAGGPVLAAWPDRRHLGEIDNDRRTRALCVVGWSPGDTEAWIAAYRPDMLGSDTLVATKNLDPVVVQGLETLSVLVNHGNNLAGSLDKRDAVDVLRRLRKAGLPLDADAIYTWALADERWNARGAERLRDLAEQIERGGQPRKGGQSALRPDILEQWRRRAIGGAEAAE